jgi:hypothetical protein
VPEPEWLGFRGFVLTDETTGRRTIVCRGTVWNHEGAGMRCYLDEGRGLERALLAQAQARLDPELFDILTRQADLPSA